MKVADLHLHPTLKVQFSDRKNPLQPGESIPASLPPIFYRACSNLGNVLESQANMKQVTDHVKLACLALYAPERELIRNKLLLKLSKKDRVERAFNYDRLVSLVAQQPGPFQFISEDELDTQLNYLAEDGGRVLPLLKDTVINFDDPNTYAVWSVEGAHSLLNTIDDFSRPDFIDIIISNLTSLAKKIPVMSVNPTHMVQYPLCNMAYGIQFIDDPVFYPVDIGFTDECEKLIRFCLDHEIMIDVKHMSPFARQQLYQLYDEWKPGVPIVCTHAGFAGIPLSSYPAHILTLRHKPGNGHYQIRVAKRKGHIYPTAFNAANINMYDEDLVNILKTGGIIGISLDRRILGFSSTDELNPDEIYLRNDDCMSKLEFDMLFAGFNIKTRPMDAGQFLKKDAIISISEVGGPIWGLHYKHVINQVLHFMMVARSHEQEIGYSWKEALNHISFGSDFDGLVDPVACAYSVEEYREMALYFNDYFLKPANELGFQLTAADAGMISYKLFYDNARAFLVERVKKLPS